MGKLFLNSKGLETKLGCEQFRAKLLEYGIDNFASKKIFIVSYTPYGVDDIIVNNCIELLGSLRENIYLSVDGIPAEEPDMVFVTAGNTFEVLQYMRDKCLIEYIRSLVLQKAAVYLGSSAGAMIAGSDIFLATDFDRNFLKMTDFTALRLFNGTIIPHYGQDELDRYIVNSDDTVLKRYKTIYSVSNEECIVIDTVE